MRDPRRIPEKVIQQQIAHFLTVLGAKVYTIGTRRPKGKLCPKCRTFVPEHQGTCQTPGLPDLLAFVPNRERTEVTQLTVECKKPGWTESDVRADQKDFREHSHRAGNAHVVGGLDEVIAWCQARGLVNANQVPWYRLPAALEQAGFARRRAVDIADGDDRTVKTVKTKVGG